MFRSGRGGDDLLLSASFLSEREVSCEGRRTFRLLDVVCGGTLSRLPSPGLFSEPSASSRVSARLCMPKVLSRCLLVGSVFCEACMECCRSSSVLMKKVVGTWFDGPLPPTEASATVDLGDRGLDEGGGSPPGSGRMVKGGNRCRSRGGCGKCRGRRVVTRRSTCTAGV